MRVASPCTENLDGMARTPSGSFCAKCQKNVVDLRRVPKRRALAVISELRASADGQVCVRVRATRDGVPVFPNEPSRLGRFAVPLALAGTLAACAPSSATTLDGTTPIAQVAETEGAANGNGAPGAHPVTGTASAVVTTPGTTPGTTNVTYPTEVVEMAGGLAFSGP
jgi:hypothetical protein